jgi:hypothetical protein
MMSAMTIATWILAIATMALALEGATFLKNWLTQIRPGRTKADIQALQQRAHHLERRSDLLQTALWMSVSSHGVSSQAYDVNRKIRDMVMLDGWEPDDQLRAEVGDYSQP